MELSLLDTHVEANCPSGHRCLIFGSEERKELYLKGIELIRHPEVINHPSSKVIVLSCHRYKKFGSGKKSKIFERK
jgi:hypothetical protein